MPQYGEVIYNPIEVYVATLNVDNTFGTPVAIDYLGKVSFNPEADSDDLMSAGMIVETLRIAKIVTGEISQGSLDFASLAVLCGITPGNYSTTPNRYSVADFKMGGAGLPYFGMIIHYASTLGANAFIGFPKAKLDTIPGFESDQNKFVIRNTGFSAVPVNTTGRNAFRIRRNETATTLASFYGSSSANFLSYFTTPPPSLFA
ncbi:MAG: hypothetical protein JNJ61_10760 [Anaerolineae bacterium]|nr:hypothetical protein [Anaerolineae bacterium]